MQYTVRNIPDYLDAALRRAARQQGKSLNETALQALVRGAGLSGPMRRKRDLADLRGSWREDPAFDKALAAQDTIDESMWPANGRAAERNAKRRKRKRAAASPTRQKRAPAA
jgi:plasmid stability protein